MKSKQERPSAINIFFLIFIIGGIVFAAYSDGVEGRMEAVQLASFDAAKSAVNLAIGLIGIMALWLGLVRVLEVGGLMKALARAVRPVMVRLFPDVPADHPAMGSMILNISANMLGLGNAATPFGVKAMIELNKLNQFPGTGTNAMCLFLAINTSSVTILPLGVIGVRAAAGAARPADIFIPTLLATICSTLTAIIVAKFFARRKQTLLVSDSPQLAASSEEQQIEEVDYSSFRYPASGVAKIISIAAVLIFVAMMLFRIFTAEQPGEFFSKSVLSYWLMPLLILLIASYGLAKGVKVYEAVTDGAKQGFEVAIKIIPFLVAILVAVAIFRASGAMDFLAAILSPVTGLLGVPAEALPMAIVRPLSGSGAFGIMSAIVNSAPDSYESFVVSTMMGSTETTFYVLAVYFGAAGVVNVRHAIVAAIAADIVGLLSACWFSAIFYVG